MRGKLARIGRKMGAPHGAGVALAMGGIFAAGAIGSSARSILDLGNEAAFGDKDADRYFLGERGLSPGSLFDASVGTGVAVGASAAGGVLGAAAGGAAGVSAGSLLRGTDVKRDINIAEKFADDIPLIGGKKVPLVGGKKILSAGKMGSGRGRAVMAGLGIAGAITGAGIGASAYTRGYVNRNKEFYQSNPYSRGSAMQASSTGAYGDIVLGMHNSRRG